MSVVPFATPELTFTVILIVVDWFGASVPIVNVSFPELGEGKLLLNTTPEGYDSNTLTLNAVSSPELFTVMLYLNVLPTITGLGESVMLVLIPGVPLTSVS